MPVLRSYPARCGMAALSGVIYALQQGPLTGTMRRESGLTFYTRIGWLAPWVMLTAGGLCWVALMLPGKRFKSLSAS